MSDIHPVSRRDLLRGRLVRSHDSSPAEKFDGGDALAGPLRPAPADPTPHPGVEGQPAMRLPELNQSLLDHDTMDQLFRDIEACTDLLAVIPKYGRQSYVGEANISLDQARRMIREHSVRAVQLRYRYDDAEWWDTLIVTAAGVQIVRIRHGREAPDSVT